MLHAFFSQLLTDLFWATTIWTVLIAVVMFVVVLLMARSQEGRRGPLDDPGPLAAQAEDLQRYAREVAVAARRAAEMARRSREEWLAAQAQADAAWRLFDRCDVAAARLNRAAAFPCLRSRAGRADRQRYLRRSAMIKCSHRQLSALELSDVLAHRRGWNPGLHPVDQEVALQRAARASTWAAYQAAAKREREAWHAAEIAVAASASLRAEAASAADRARRAGFACRVAQRNTVVRTGPRTRARKIGELLLPVGFH